MSVPRSNGESPDAGLSVREDGFAAHKPSQFVGRFRDEASVLRAGALYEASERWLERWPDL